LETDGRVLWPPLRRVLFDLTTQNHRAAKRPHFVRGVSTRWQVTRSDCRSGVHKSSIPFVAAVHQEPAVLAGQKIGDVAHLGATSTPNLVGSLTSSDRLLRRSAGCQPAATAHAG